MNNQNNQLNVTGNLPLNKDIVGKYVILNDISCQDFMKDENGKMIVFDTLEDACTTCGMYEFEDAIVVKIEYNHVEM